MVGGGRSQASLALIHTTLAKITGDSPVSPSGGPGAMDPRVHTGTPPINGADTTFTGIGVGIVCTVTPTYPPGVSGPESFDTPEVTAQTPAVISSVAVFGATTPHRPHDDHHGPGDLAARDAPPTTVPTIPTTTLPVRGTLPTTVPTIPTTTLPVRGTLPATGTGAATSLIVAALMVLAGVVLATSHRKPRQQ